MRKNDCFAYQSWSYLFNTFVISPWHFLVVACPDYHFVQPDLGRIHCVRFLVKFVTGKTGLPSHLNSVHVFPCDNIRKTFIVMHNPVFEHLYKLSFALRLVSFCR